MKRKISIFINIGKFNVTLHNVDLILNNKFFYHIDKLDTGKRILIDTTKFKNVRGNHFPFFRRPKTIEVRAKEGIIKIGTSEIIYEP